ncbi:TonB-dependent receptor plug domain-containing protein [Prosthecobacter fusiformis]|nr:TonB-dependent receptor [Prosthecobacter fusiformis]
MHSFSSNYRKYRYVIPYGVAGVLLCTVATAQEVEDFRPSTLKNLSLDQLVDVEITSVSRRPEPLLKASSAIDVLTSEEIRRSGATNLPDALRLATGLHVAQFDGHSWAISARGFNSTTANKLQVLMDGRSLYTPLYAGVFWDVQHTFLPDIEQIEVIRGPGATLWGANAVNGVINIRTKTAQETQGWMMQGGRGTEENGFGGIRYGGKIGDSTYYRAYVTTLNRDSLSLELNGDDSLDEYALTKGGFRMDSELTSTDTLTLQGDLYTGRFGQVVGDDIEVGGGNMIIRWNHEISNDESFWLQAYYDRTYRLVPGSAEETRNSYDIEMQHSKKLTPRQHLIWGLNARASEDQIGEQAAGAAFLPANETLYLFSGYLQDDIQVLPDLLMVTLGSKFEYNSFSGFEYQPSLRFALTPTERQTFWGSVARAVRTPSRIDQDVYIPNPQISPAILRNNRDFDSEVLIAYELGHRAKWSRSVTTDLALFYNDYDKVRSIETVGSPPTHYVFANGVAGETYGAELDVKWQPTRWWQLGLGYTIMQTNLRTEPGSTDPTEGSGEFNDPNHILVIRSSMDLPGNVELDATFRHVDELQQTALSNTPAYSTVDIRLAWRPTNDLELAIVGRNLLDASHTEFRRNATREIGRSVYFMATWSF